MPCRAATQGPLLQKQDAAVGSPLAQMISNGATDNTPTNNYNICRLGQRDATGYVAPHIMSLNPTPYKLSSPKATAHHCCEPNCWQGSS
eukprot:1245-Amphidinium_carterae.1